MNDLEILQTLIKAKELGISKKDIEDFKARISPKVLDAKPEDLVKPLSTFDDLSEDEIQYFATPYFDELQNKKEAQKQKLAEEKT